MKATEINKIQQVSRPPSATVIAQSHFFLYKISKNQHLNCKNILSVELLDLSNNFPLILVMNPT